MQDAEMKSATLAGAWDQANQIGYYGNVFIRVHSMPKAGDKHDGHAHHFDHVTIVAQGGIKVRWRRHEGGDPAAPLLACGEKVFTAPTFVTINKDTFHEITATADGTVWMCAYAIPEGLHGDTSPFHSERNSPYV